MKLKHLTLAAQEFNAVANDEDSNKSLRVKGYASVFSQVAELFPGLEIQIQKGAFSETIAKDDVRAIWNHDWNIPLARTTNGTLKLSEDETGLAFDMELSDTTWGRDAHTSISRGDVVGMSFGFSVEQDEWIQGSANSPDRLLIKKVKLYEISPTPIPVFKGTSVYSASVNSENWGEFKEKFNSLKYDEKAAEERTLNLSAALRENNIFELEI